MDKLYMGIPTARDGRLPQTNIQKTTSTVHQICVLPVESERAEDTKAPTFLLEDLQNKPMNSQKYKIESFQNENHDQSDNEINQKKGWDESLL